MAMERLVNVLRQTGGLRDEAIADGIDALRKLRGKDISIAYLESEQVTQPLTRRPLPLYEQTAMSIRDKILLGEYPTGSRIPSELDLLKQYSPISRGTLRVALRMLAEEGLIKRMQGAGTFVLYHQQRKEASGLSENSEDFPVK